MFILSMAFLGIIIFILETVVIDLFTIGGINPDFILIVAIYSGLCLDKNIAAGIGFAFGLVQDALSFKLMGINSLSKCLIGFSIGSLREEILGENLLVQYLFTFMATFLNGTIFLLISKGLLSMEIETLSFFWSLLIQGIYNSLLAPPVFLLFNKIRRLYYKNPVFYKL